MIATGLTLQKCQFIPKLADSHPFLVQYYPGCLAQALYSAFCHAFPKSNKILNSENFLSFLCDLTSEWISGTCTVTAIIVYLLACIEILI